MIVSLRPPLPLPQNAGGAISFNFEEAPVSEVVRTILGDVVKADYVLHPPLACSITLSTKSPVAPDQALFLLETAPKPMAWLYCVMPGAPTMLVGRTHSRPSGGPFGKPQDLACLPGMAPSLFPAVHRCV